MPRANPVKRKGQSNVAKHVRLYEQKRPQYLAFTGKLSSLIHDLLEAAEIKYHIIESRTKEVQSFREKITRANKHYTDPLSEITDLSGLRLILYYLEDVDAACRLIEREFSIDKNSSLDKGELLGPNEFGYRSVHFIVSLPGSRDALPEWRSFAGLSAEIQVRTVLQHAWASISHTLDYKREVEVPVPLRRKLSRLAGLLELSDEEFSDLRMRERAFSGTVRMDLARGATDIQLDAVSLARYFAESKALQLIIESAKAAGFTVVRNRDDEYSSGLIGLCVDFGIKTVKELDEELIRSHPWVKNYFSRLFQIRIGSEDPESAWIAPEAFLVELVLLRSHSDGVTVDYLVKREWDDDIAERVVKAAKMVH